MDGIIRRELRSRGFYVYQHIRLDTGEIFYVGKGGGSGVRASRRAYTFNRIENKHYCNVINKMIRLGLDVAIEFVAENLTEKEAFELERKLIRQLGRHDLGLGLLCNQTDGGDGSSGTIVSEKTKKLLSKQRRGVPKSPEHRANLTIHLRQLAKTPEAKQRLIERNKRITCKGIPKSAEHRAKIGDAHRGVPKSAEQKERLSAAHMGKVLSLQHRSNISAGLRKRYSVQRVAMECV